MERIALYPGTFNPMTTGHLNIIKRASSLFDKVFVAIGRNSDKSCSVSDEERYRAACRAVEGIANVKVVTYDCLTTDLCIKLGVSVIVRGIRSVADYEYERNIADINRLIAPGIETVCLFADSRFAAVSSSMVRELQRYGKDVSDFIV